MIVAILIAIAFLIVLVLFIPWLVTMLLNRKLEKIEGLTGHIERVQIRLFAGKIILNDLNLATTIQYGKQTKLKLPQAIIRFSWKLFFKHFLDVQVLLDSPDVLMTSEKFSIPEKPSSSSNGVATPKAALEKLRPFRLNLEVRNGSIFFNSASLKRKIELAATEINMSVSNLTNQKEQTEACMIKCSAQLYDGNMEVNVSLQPLEPTLTLDLNLQLASINLVLLNDLLRSFGKVDVNKGTLDLTAKVAVSNNEFKGYIKPIFKELDFVGAADKDDSLLQKIWERTVAGFVQLMENRRKDQIATKIPIQGRLDDPHVHVVKAIIGVLKNAFVKALTPSLDDIIGIDSIWKRAKSRTKEFFKSIFRKEKAV